MVRFLSYRSFCFAALCLVAAGSSLASKAGVLQGGSAGQGVNSSFVVIDFGFFGGEAYLFEYRYDGSATSEDMLLALDAQTDLTVRRQFFDFGSGPSIYIDGFEFKTNQQVPSFEGSAGESWGFWTVDDPINHPASYSSPPVGPTDRQLTDGSIDGWSLNVSNFNSLGLPATSTPPAAVPEPATAIAILAPAGLTLVRRRRRINGRA